jgi:hypothetical protein
MFCMPLQDRHELGAHPVDRMRAVNALTVIAPWVRPRLSRTGTAIVRMPISSSSSVNA